MPTLTDLTTNRLLVAIVSLVAGALLTKLSARTKALSYWVRSERLALTADDPVFGSVRVTLGDVAVRNLHMVSIELENMSNHDFENVGLKVYTGNHTVLLGERTAVEDSPHIVHWSKAYADAMEVPHGEQPTPAQWSRHGSSREYTVPVLNRSQRLTFQYLCTRPNDDERAHVWMDTQLKGARLTLNQSRLNLVFGVPVQVALVRGLVASVLVAAACGLTLKNVWAASALCLAVGLFAQAIGAAEYKAERWLAKKIAG